MAPKADPHATKLHRVDELLILVIALLIALILRDSADGESIVRVAPQPFWSSLRIFQLQPKVAIVPLAYVPVTLAEPDSIAASRADLSDLRGIVGGSKGDFALIVVVPEGPSTFGKLSNLESVRSYYGVVSLGPGLTDNWSNVYGAGSVILSYSADFGEPAMSSVAAASQPASLPLMESDVIRRSLSREEVTGPASVVSSPVNFNLQAGPRLAGGQSMFIGDTISLSRADILSGGSEVGSVRHVASKVLSVAPDTITANGQTDLWSDMGGATAWLATANWDTGTPPGTSGHDLDLAQFANAGTATTGGIDMSAAGGNLQIGGVEMTSTRTRVLIIGNSSSTAGTLTLMGNTVNSVANVILRNASDSLLTLQDNETGSGKTMDVALGNATNNVINIDGAGGITISSVIKNGIANASLTLGGSGAGILTFSGTAANTYSGTTTIDAGELDLNKTAGTNAIAGAIAINGGSLKLLANNQIIDSGLVTVSGGTLDIGNFTDTVAGVTLAGGNITGIGGTLTGSSYDVRSGSISASLGGSGVTLTKATAGTVTLSGNNIYTGPTSVTAGILAESSTGFISDSSNLTVNGATAVFDIGANHIDFLNTITLDGEGTLTGTGTSSLNALGTLEMKSGTVNVTLGGNNGLVFNKTTGGTVTLNAAGAWTGLTTITGGTLAEGPNGSIHDTSSLLINGATFDLGANHSDLVGVVTLQNGGIINGSGTSTLTTNTGATFELQDGTVNAILAGGINKSTSGTVTLFGVNNTVSLNITAGTVVEGVNNSIFDSGDVTVSGATAVFDMGSNHTDMVRGILLDNGGAIIGSGSTLTSDFGPGMTVSSGSVSVNLAGVAPLNKTTAGTVILSGTNTYTGGTFIHGGTLQLGANNVFLDSGNFTLDGGGTLDFNSRTDTVGDILLNGNGILSGSSGILTGSNTLGVQGTGNQISSGTVSVAGLTTITGSSGLAVNGILSGAGAVSIGGTLSGAGTVSKVITIVNLGHLAPGNSIGTITLGSLILSAGSILDYEFGVGNDFTNVTTAGGLTLSGGGFNLYQDGTLTAFSTNGTYSLIGYTGTLGGSLSNLSVSNVVFGKTYTFGTTGSNITLTIGTIPAPDTAYWKGNIDSAWNSSFGTTSNFTIDLAGTTSAHQLAGPSTDVFFTATGGSQVTSVLGQNFTINSLTFNGNAASSSNISGNILTLNAGSGNGITVDSGSGGHTISSNVALGAGQTWTNHSANALTVSGIISGGFDLATAGTGIIAFSGPSANTYSGVTTVSAGELDLKKSSGVAIAGDLSISGGTAKLFGGNQIATSSSITVSGGTLAIQGFSNTVAGIQLSSGAITGTGGTLTSTSDFDVRSGSASAILGGSVALDKTTSGTATLTGPNTYTGATLIEDGTLDAAGVNALGATSIITVNNGGTLLISNSVSTNHVKNTALVSQAGGTIKISTGVSEGTAATVTGGSVSGTSLVGLGALTLTSNSLLDFDSGGASSLLVFNSFMPGSYVLTIAGYTNSHFDGSSNSGLSSDDRLVFAADQASNLDSFDFGMGPGVDVGEILLDSGFYEVGVNVPSPPTIISPLMAAGTANLLFSYQFEATGATSLSVDMAALPAGLIFDSSISAIVGVAGEAPGTFPIALTASNEAGTTNATLMLTIQALPSDGPVLISSTSAKGRTGSPFVFQVITRGASAAAQLQADNLPPGLSLDPMSGLIFGTPSSDGSGAVSLTVNDGQFLATETLELTFTSDLAIPVIVSPSRATLYPGEAFSYTIDAPSSANPAIDATTYAIEGDLPPGLTFDPIAGTISGTPLTRTSLRPSPNLSGGVVTNVQLFATNSHGTGTIPLVFFLPPLGAVNISTRLAIGIEDNVLIGGFIITGNAPKQVLIRALGPSLPVTGALQDTTLGLYDSSAQLATNDNWRDSQEQEIIASTIPPTDDRESCILATLEPGAYTAIVGGKNGSTGVGLVEIYDLGTASFDIASEAQLANISTRGLVQTDDNVMIGGFIISGTDPVNILVRAIGPELNAKGVSGALQDPILELYDGNGALLDANDDWQSDNEQEIIDTTIPPTDPRESAIVGSLNAGAYTAILRGKNLTTGVALVEVYILP